MIESENPFYDVVICVRDMAQFIEETIRNLQSAELPPKTIWVIDDASSDSTVEKASAFKDVEVLQNEINKGKSFSRNLGITSSKAPFIQLIDADDLIAPEKTKNQLDYLLKNPHLDAVFGDVQHFVDSAEGRVFRPVLTYKVEDDMLEQLIKKNIYALHSFFFKRSFFEKSGLMDERLVTSQDRELWIRSLLNGCQIQYLPGNIAFYRRHETSTIASQQQIVAYYNALAVEIHATFLFSFKRGKYKQVTRETLRMLARNSNRYLRSFKEIDLLINKAYSASLEPILLNQNPFYNFLEKIIGGRLTERLLRPKFMLDHKLGRYGVKF